MFSSIKFKLTLLYSFSLLLTLGIYSTLAYYYMQKNLLDGLDASLRSEVEWIRDAIEPAVSNFESTMSEFEEENADSLLEDEIWNIIYEHSLLSSKKQFIQIKDKNGREIYRSLSLGSLDLPIDSVSVENGKIFIMTIDKFNHHKIRLAVLKSDYLTIGVAYPLDEVTHAMANLIEILIFLIPIPLLISIIGGILLARKALKPVDDIVKTATKITAGNLNLRIPEPSSNDEIARLIRTLNNMINQLENSFERMKQFSADVSHEFKTPLTIIRGEIELALSKNKRASSLRKTLANILDEVVRLSNMVEDLLTLFKSDIGQVKLNFREVDIVEIIKDLLEDIYVLAKKKKIKIEVGRLDSAIVLGDEMRLKQLFLNLIDNAIKYNKSGGKVTISVENKVDIVSVSISDTGVGIPEDELGLIFERFYRVDKARSRDSGGVGLGLSIARWIAESHNGKIEVESRVGQGSKFSVILPTAGGK